MTELSTNSGFKGDPDLHAVNLEKKKLGVDSYNQEVVSFLPIGRGLAKMTEILLI